MQNAFDSYTQCCDANINHASSLETFCLIPFSFIHAQQSKVFDIPGSIKDVRLGKGSLVFKKCRSQDHFRIVLGGRALGRGVQVWSGVS